PGDIDGERQRWQIATVLDRVDRLTGNPQRHAEGLLRQVTGVPQLPDPVLHGCKAYLSSEVDVKCPFHADRAHSFPNVFHRGRMTSRSWSSIPRNPAHTASVPSNHTGRSIRAST